jgi:hypothetical protein
MVCDTGLIKAHVYLKLLSKYMNDDLWYPGKHLWYLKGHWYHSLRTAGLDLWVVKALRVTLSTLESLMI